MVHLAFHKGSGLQIQVSSQGDHRDRYILLLRGDELAGGYEMLMRQSLSSLRPIVSDVLVGHFFKGTIGETRQHDMRKH